MAALDTFMAFNDSLSDTQRVAARELILSRMDELLGARSEDARVRLVSKHIDEVREGLQQTRRQEIKTTR